MHPQESGTLAVPGARLHFEVRGEGSPVLLIAGGNSDAAVFKRLADVLAVDHRVITYDPRGNSRSLLDGPPTDQRVEEHTDDAYRLLDHLTGPGESAYVFGSCSGGLVALELAVRSQDRVRLTIAHEPPAMGLLPDAEEYLAFFDDIHETFRREGVAAALRKLQLVFGDGPAPTLPEAHDNTAFFLAHTVRPVTRFVPDLGKLVTMADRIVVAGGRDSRTHAVHRPAVVLAERLGCERKLFPGGHVGYARYPAEFARRLVGLFAAPSGTATPFRTGAGG